MAALAGSWQCGGHCLDVRRPLIMGIVNVTPDSFSDGGEYFSLESAYRQAMTLLDDGADILDVGGESTRPGAAPVEEREEERRILPLVERLAAAGAVVSVDTMKPALMRATLDSGAAIINDVNGFRAAGAVEAVVKASCGLVVVHMRGCPRTMQEAPIYDDVVAEVGAFLRARVEALMAAGVDRARLCVDPGIGFGKTQQHNVILINHLHELAMELPLLAGISRKSIFCAVNAGAPAAKRDVMSAVAAVLLLQRGAVVLRVHNVAMTAEAIATWQLIDGQA